MSLPTNVGDRVPFDKTSVIPPLLPSTTMESFTSYIARSFAPKSFGRLCILGVDLVGVPVLLFYGLPQNRVMLVAGWFGLRIALTGIRYLETRDDRDKVLEENVRVLEAKNDSTGAFSEEPNTVAQRNEDQEISTRPRGEIQMPVGRPQTPVLAEEAVVEAPVQQAKEVVGVEFPRIKNEPEEISPDVGPRMARTVSMTSTDSNTTIESECLTTPPQTMSELPVESDYADEDELLTPRPDQIQRFSSFQVESPQSSPVWPAHDIDAHSSGQSSPDSRRPPLRKKSSKYGSCPRLLVPKRSNPSLHLSQVTYDKAFTA